VIYEDREQFMHRIQLITAIPILIYNGFVFLNLNNGFIFVITQETGYIAQTYEFMIFGIAYLYMGLMLTTIYLNRRYIDVGLRVILITYVIITSIFVGIQYFYPHFLLVGTASGLSILIMYLYIQSKELVSDYLTRLPNRVAYESILKYRIRATKNLQSIVICLREFKNINSMYGQKNGDVLLKELSSYFMSIVDRIDVFRYSGDRFALLYDENYFNTDELIKIIQNRFKSSWLVKDALIYLEVDIIHVNIRDHVSNHYEVVSLIDYLIEKVKSHPNRLPIYSSVDTIYEMKRRAILSETIKNAMNDNRFEIAVQPIISVESNLYHHAEVLLRLTHPELGQISPLELIPLAEESGQIIELGLWVLRQALKFLKQCDENGIYIETVSVNFSVVQMNDANLLMDVKHVLDDYPKYANKIMIEITESIFIADYQRIISQMYGLRDLGLGFYLDDFGTGYSNILHVIKLPLNVIKIDKSLVYESIHNPLNYNLINGLCEAFSESGMKVLAEGIETDEQYEAVRLMEIDYIQGYLFSRPLSVTNALEFFKNHQV
jgi:diguanylate cyclase (GGDEF)-like protein